MRNINSMSRVFECIALKQGQLIFNAIAQVGLHSHVITVGNEIFFLSRNPEANGDRAWIVEGPADQGPSNCQPETSPVYGTAL